MEYNKKVRNPQSVYCSSPSKDSNGSELLNPQDNEFFPKKFEIDNSPLDKNPSLEEEKICSKENSLLSINCLNLQAPNFVPKNAVFLDEQIFT